MKLTLRIGAAMGIVALAGWTQGGQDNTENAEMNAGYANETALPPDENVTGTDTLGNQMNQLNESNMNTDMDNMSEDTTNTQ